MGVALLLANVGFIDGIGVASLQTSQNWWTFNGLTTIFTGLLFFVGTIQAGLFVWQLKLIRNELAHTKTAAEAAKKSADTAERALTELERPWVIVHLHQGVHWEEVYVDTLNEERLNPYVKFDIVNLGRFPASLNQCHIGAERTNSPASITILHNEFHGFIAPEVSSFKDVKQYFSWTIDKPPDNIGISDSDLLFRNAEATDDIFVYFYIVYTGVRKEPIYESKFCWRWDRGVDRWVRYNDDRYNHRT